MTLKNKETSDEAKGEDDIALSKNDNKTLDMVER
jgi:hypothetical protein